MTDPSATAADGSATTATRALTGPADVSAVTPLPPQRMRVTGVWSFTSMPFAKCASSVP